MLNAIVLNVIMLSVIMLNVTMLSVIVPMEMHLSQLNTITFSSSLINEKRKKTL